jgi:hypothetical protein
MEDVEIHHLGEVEDMEETLGDEDLLHVLHVSKVNTPPCSPSPPGPPTDRNPGRAGTQSERDRPSTNQLPVTGTP